MFFSIFQAFNNILLLLLFQDFLFTLKHSLFRKHLIY